MRGTKLEDNSSHSFAGADFVDDMRSVECAGPRTAGDYAFDPVRINLCSSCLLILFAVWLVARGTLAEALWKPKAYILQPEIVVAAIGLLDWA